MRTATVLLGFGLLASALSFAWTGEPSADLKAQVKKLVDQLGDDKPETQTIAETALLKLGAEALPFLPDPEDNLKPDQRRRLKSILRTLRDAQVQKELQPRPVTIQDMSLPLDKALAEVARQTGVELVDRRENKEDNPKLKLDLNKATFWQAADAIAREADLRLSLYEKDRKVVLREGPNRTVPVSYSGLFRIAVKRVTATRDLEADNANYCVVFLEVAWEPRFLPVLLEAKADSWSVQDDKGAEVKASGNGNDRLSVSDRIALEVPLRMEAPPRSAAKLGALKGAFTMIGPGKMLTFDFDQLTEIKKPMQARKVKKEGIQVTLDELTVEPERWTIGVVLEYPSDGPDFESFESWLVHNKMQLEKNGGKTVVPENGGSNIDAQTGQRAVLKYYFVEEDELKLGKPQDWKLVYKTPGPFVNVPLTFEFKDLPLP